METCLHIGLDLGSDTLKIAYAYEKQGQTYYGKIVEEEDLTRSAIPAIAYWDEESKTWLFGGEVDAVPRDSYVNVVKIKALLSLTFKNANERVFRKNKDCYFHGNYFPKYYFPVRRKMSKDFSAMIKEDMTFLAEGYTPQRVCRAFFAYVKKVVDRRVAYLAKTLGVTFSAKQKISLVHPSLAGKAYLDELEELTENAFGVKPTYMLSSTKALAMYAFERGELKKGEGLLVFDMGEERISVAQASLSSEGKVVVDGMDGHNGPVDIGGDDVDDAVCEFIEQEIYERETMGTRAFGEEGHIQEGGVYAMQYKFMKEIKDAKTILSMEFADKNAFADGVPVSVWRDLKIQRDLTRAQFAACLGIGKKKGIAIDIARYIIQELDRPINNGIKKVFLSGGLTETYALVDYLKQEIAKKHDKISVVTFDDGKTESDGHTILSHEDSSYAPAVGGAVVSLKSYDVRTVVSLSYATWVTHIIDGTRKKVLEIFLDRGSPLPDRNAPLEKRLKKQQWVPTVPANGSGVERVKGEELFSATITTGEIAAKKHDRKMPGQYRIANFNTCLLIGDAGSDFRRKAEAAVGLRSIVGGPNSEILFYYEGKRIRLYSQVWVAEGMEVDSEGRARPFLANDVEKNANAKADIAYVSGGRRFTVDASQIEFKCPDFPTIISLSAND